MEMWGTERPHLALNAKGPRRTKIGKPYTEKVKRQSFEMASTKERGSEEIGSEGEKGDRRGKIKETRGRNGRFVYGNGSTREGYKLGKG